MAKKFHVDETVFDAFFKAEQQNVTKTPNHQNTKSPKNQNTETPKHRDSDVKPKTKTSDPILPNTRSTVTFNGDNWQYVTVVGKLLNNMTAAQYINKLIEDDKKQNAALYNQIVKISERK